MIKSFEELITQARGRRVLYRADFNVPMDAENITDDTRIKLAIQSLVRLKQAGAKVIIASHLGRPKGQPNPKYSCRALVDCLSKHLQTKVAFCEQVVGKQVEKESHELKDGEFLLIENLRFVAGEEQNDAGFAEQLGKLCDFVVVDAFACAHRRHASMHAITKIKPAVAGELLQREFDMLSKITTNPPQPLIVVLAGSKISTKIGVIEALLKKADKILIAGGMANTMLAAAGHDMGKSLVEKESLALAKTLLAAASADKLVLPSDLVVVEKFPAKGQEISAETIKVDALEPHHIALDVGPRTIAHWSEIIESAGSLLWNGPLGMFEVKPFDEASNKLAEKVALLTKNNKLISVAGGGDTLAALSGSIELSELTYYSTAGGAFIEFAEGKKLPALVALGMQ